MLQTDKVKLTWRDRFPAYFTNLVSIIFMVSSRRLEGLGIRSALHSSWDTMRERVCEGHPSSIPKMGWNRFCGGPGVCDLNPVAHGFP